MAAVSTLQYGKRKKAVYGKTASSNFNVANFDSFFGDDELSGPKTTSMRSSSVKSAYTVEKPEAKSHALKKPTRPHAKQVDTFDVPSSGDDDEISYSTKYVPPPKYTPKLVDDRDAGDVKLTAWERRRLDSSHKDENVPTKRNRRKFASPETQLTQELERASISPQKPRNVESTPRNKRDERKSVSALTSPDTSAEVNPSSAAARLAARRKLADSGAAPSSGDEIAKAARTISKRPALAADSESTPRKRIRTVYESRESSVDVLMADASSEPLCELSPPPTKAEADIYDFPDSSADEISKSKSTIQSPKATKKPARRGKLTAYSSRTTPRKGVSAPPRLSEMIATDTDTTEAPTRSPSESTSRRSTPHQPSTPPSAHIGSPETAIKATGTMTPKQAQLWSKLLPSDLVTSSPSTLLMQDLSISSKRRTGVSSLSRTLTKSQSDVPRRRTKLVDRLKASAPSSDNESSDADEDEDSEMAEVTLDIKTNTSAPKENETAKSVSRQNSQSQNQSASATAAGPKITYARIRSYLPEDNLEDDLMAGLSADTPQHPTIFSRGVGRSAPLSQKSAFDLDDSEDEENGTGRIRTIHELRASGRNIRGMEDIEELLDEIQNHNPSHKSRRRSALIDLATKLADKSFIVRFVGQSYESRLAAECRAVSDEIADFVLAASVALIMASEPPEHAVRTWHDHGVVSWLVRLLEQSKEIAQLAKDRKNNMSKASQSSLLDFAETAKKQTSLWEDEMPTAMTPRLVALKALDLLVSKLRRLGDRTELLLGDQLLPVLGDTAGVVPRSKVFEFSLAISVLESLSTSSVSLNWPEEVVGQLGVVLTILGQDIASPLQRHATFLMLRLCLNLTNDNARNCGLLYRVEVPYLMSAVKTGFQDLDTEDDEKRTIALDLLVLALGIMINLAEQCEQARQETIQYSDNLEALIQVFQKGQKHMLDAESVEESISNVAFGYLAVMFANLCRNDQVRSFIAQRLPGKNLDMLVEAVGEFVLHHQKVDMMNFEGEEGREVWGAFTEKLRVVLARLKEAELNA